MKNIEFIGNKMFFDGKFVKEYSKRFSVIDKSNGVDKTIKFSGHLGKDKIIIDDITIK